MKKRPRSYKVNVTRVLDGDTFDCFVELGFETWIKKRVRISNINAPELGGPHHEVSVKATEALHQLLKQAQVVILTNSDEHDEYGRLLAQVFVFDKDKDPLTPVFVIDKDKEPIDVGKSLVKQRLARPWY